jgi:hypothetical protein
VGIILDLLEYIPWQKRGRNILQKVEKYLKKGNNLGRHSHSRSAQSLSTRTVATATVVLGPNSGEWVAYL